MKKFLLASVFAMSIAPGLFAQEDDRMPERRTCAADEKYQEMLRTDPEFAANRKKIEAFTEDYIRRQSQSPNKTLQGTPQYVIPVVVHVVYRTNAQNVSNAQIQSQIDVLNKDFQKLNSDVTKVPSVWTSLVADAKIQFCLATIDPLGNPTTGIIRKQTSKSSFGTNDAVKKNTQGGSSPWPTKDYLNIWVCNLSSGLLGYAQFPGGPAATDGVVIDFQAFGTVGTAQAPFNLGRTATHEVGHWLNLRHIWGDDGTGCSGSDLVGDTPNQGGPNYGCPAFPRISCSNGPNGDMWMNFMDYTDDRCMYMFTLGQDARIDAVLGVGGAHYSVTQSGRCGSLSPAAKPLIAEKQTLLQVSPNPVVTGVPMVSYTLHNAAKLQLVATTAYGSTAAVINLGSQAAGKYNIHPAELARLQNGIYMLKLVANGVPLATTQIVVQH